MKNRVGDFIAARGMTVYQFIKQTGVSQATGYKLARNPEHLPSISVLNMLCETFKTQPSEFIYWEE